MAKFFVENFPENRQNVGFAKIETVQILGQQKLFRLNENNNIQVLIEFIPDWFSELLARNCLMPDLDSLRFYFRLTGIDGRANPNGEKQDGYEFS